MISKYFTRKGVETEYLRIINGGYVEQVKVKNMSDYQLLRALNRVLLQNSCIGLEANEFELELH